MHVSLAAIQNILPKMHKLLSDRLSQMSGGLDLTTFHHILSNAYQPLSGELSRLSAALHLKPGSLVIGAIAPVIWLLIRFVLLPGQKEIKSAEET